MDKRAAVIARNLKQFSKAVNNIPKQTGHRLSKNGNKIVDDVVKGQGTGSFLLDFFGGKITKKPFVADKINKIQREATDLDMRAGAKAYDLLNKGLDNKKNLGRIGKARKGLANQFLKEYSVDMAPRATGVPEVASKIKSTSLLNPVDKAKDVALPMVGGMTVANKMMPIKEDNTGGDKMPNQISERENLANKIAASLGIQFQSREKVAKTNDAQLLKEASELLAGAADEIKTLRAQVEKLALENREYELKEIRKSREEEGCKIATEMYEKGLIKKADIEKKSSEIALMEHDSLELFKEALDGVEAPVDEGVDKLTFVIDGDNIEKRGSFAGSIVESAKYINK